MYQRYVRRQLVQSAVNKTVLQKSRLTYPTGKGAGSWRKLKTTMCAVWADLTNNKVIRQKCRLFLIKIAAFD